MKLKKFLSALVSGAMILGTMAAVPIFAEETDNTLIEVSDSNTLKAAVNNIAENGTIKFTNGITVTRDGGNDPGVITFTKNCTVDLNGQTLNTGELVWFAGSEAVTFTSSAENGTIKFGNITDSVFRPNENGSFSIENITFTQTENAEVCYLFNMNGENSSINLKNCVLDNINTASYGGVICGNNSVNTKASIENCRITNINGVAVFGGQVTVKDSTISATTPFKIARDNHYAVLSGETTITITGDNNEYNGNKIYTIGKDVTVDSRIPTTVPAATIGTTPYATLAAALAAAQGGDTIDLLGNTVQLNGQTTIDKNITIVNGTFDIANAVCTTEGIIYIDNKTVKFNDVDFVGSNFTSAFGVIYANNNAKVTLDSCDFNLKNDMSASGGTLKGNNNSKFIVNNCTFDLENPSRVLTGITLNMSDTTINAYVTDQTRVEGVLNNHAFRNVYGEIKNSTINVTGTETGIKNTAGGELKVSGNSAVTFSNTVGANIYLKDANETLTVEPSANVIGDIVYGNMSNEVITDTIAVKLAPTDKANVYDIVLDGNGKLINRFMSAELAFEYTPTEGDIAYEINGADNVNIVDPAASGKDAYEFNLQGKTATGADVPDMTGARLTIGKVVFTGYGKGTFNIKGTDINFVNTATYSNNIVNHFVVGGGTGFGTLVLPAAATDIDIAVPTKKLTVNITFPNAVNDNENVYQSMNVTIAGGTTNETIKLGKGTDETKMTDGAYKIEKDLPENTPYTVTVEGLGYRTARYTVNMATDKTLNFWNNVMDTAQVVEVNKQDSAVKTNFLAGDIVKDNNINIYDLSAVVSYFGENDLVTDHQEYAKYDLNRDGKIDSKDVAYVLVSWNN